MREEGFVNTKTKSKKVKLPFKLDKFINIFGGIDNITKASVSHNKLKVYYVSRDKVDLEELKKIKNHGIFDQSDTISIVLTGHYAKDLSGMINDLITLNNTKVLTDVTTEIDKKPS